MGCLDFSMPCDSLLAVTASGCKSGRFIPLGFKSCWSCSGLTFGSSFEDLLKLTYRDDGNGNMGIGFVTESADVLSCSDFSQDNVFCVLGVMVLGFCIADDDQIALLLITP
jgi:hypothetical protein